MKNEPADWSWSTEVVYACICGAHFPATRWRWIDEAARPRVAQKARRRGPVEGTCHQCGRQAGARLAWASLRPGESSASLILGDHHRADLPRVLREHIEQLERRPEWATPWMLQPSIDFAMAGVDTDEEDTNPGRRPTKASARPIAIAHRDRGRSQPAVAAGASKPAAAKSSPKTKTGAHKRPRSRPQEAAQSTKRDRSAPRAMARKKSEPVEEIEVSVEPTPELELEVDLDVEIDTAVTAAEEITEVSEIELSMEDEGDTDPRASGRKTADLTVTATLMGSLAHGPSGVTVTAAVDADTGEFWRTADVVARPVFFRGFGYPLVGVRLVGAGVSDRAVIDAVLDVGVEQTSAVFVELSRDFRVQLTAVDQRGTLLDERLVHNPGLERNAAMCLESARAQLGSGDYPPAAFDEGVKRLAGLGLEKRLAPAKYPAAVVDTIELVSPARTWQAIDLLNDVSKKENLTHLLEVDGLPVGDYERLRRRVLEVALSFGLRPPKRFWRRVLGSDMVDGAADWIAKLVEARKVAVDQGVDDLTPEQAGEAWHRIRELCSRQRVPEPEALKRVFSTKAGRGKPVPRMRRSTQPPISASGEIGDDPPARKAKIKKSSIRDSRSSGEDLQNPQLRLARATDILSAPTVSPQALGLVFDALDRFDIGELLAILPSLSDLGPRVVPGLVDKLDSPRRELRQSAAIILGMVGDRRAVEPMIKRLVVEDTRVWIDISRALGSFGPRVIGPLCDLLQDTPARDRDFVVKRVSRAMAEVVLSDGDDEGGPGRVAVEALVDVGDPALSGAAREALVTLNGVKNAGEIARGERPQEEDTVVRGFSRLAYEAITVPEMEVEMNDLEDLGG